MTLPYEPSDAGVKQTAVERFGEESVGPDLYAAQVCLLPYRGRQQYHRNMADVEVRAQMRCKLYTVHFRHHYITDNKVRLNLRHQCQRILSVCCRVDCEMLLKKHPEHLAHVVVVIDDQYAVAACIGIAFPFRFLLL